MAGKITYQHKTTDSRGPYNLSHIVFEYIFSTIKNSFPSGLYRSMSIDEREKGRHMAWSQELGKEEPSQDKLALEVKYDASDNSLEVVVEEDRGVTYEVIDAKIKRYEESRGASVSARKTGKK